jgi:DNA invertase Pin-like site-specific DNA recombinase
VPAVREVCVPDSPTPATENHEIIGVVDKLDRFGRSLLDCLANLRELDSHGVRFIATTQSLDTDNDIPELLAPCCG